MTFIQRVWWLAALLAVSGCKFSVPIKSAASAVAACAPQFASCVAERYQAK